MKLLLATSAAMNALIDTYPGNIFKLNAEDFDKYKDMTWFFRFKKVLWKWRCKAA